MGKHDRVCELIDRFSSPDDSCVTVRVPMLHDGVQAYVRTLRSSYMAVIRRNARLDTRNARRRRIALHG